MSKRQRTTVAMTLEQLWHRVPGGTAVAALGMARSLVALGSIDVVGVAARHKEPAPEEWSPPVGVRHLPFPRPVLYESWHRFRRPKVERATGRADVIHATSFAIPPRSAPLVVTVHDLAWLQRPEHFTRRGVSFFNRGLELTLSDADVVLCPSEATIRDCRSAGFQPDRLRHVPLGVDAEDVTDEDVKRIRGSYGLGERYVLWTGTVEPRKNLPNLLRAFAGVDADVELVLAGPRGWNEDLQELVAPVRGRVRSLGFVPRKDLAPLYAGADLFCWPSLLEGFGFPVLEAMAQGTPVVTSRGTSTEEVAQGAGVLVDPTDPASIAKGMTSVLNDNDLAGKLSRAGRARAAEYSWERCARKVEAAYAEVAA